MKLFCNLLAGLAIVAGMSQSSNASAINFGAGTNFVDAATDVQPLALIDKAYGFGVGGLSIDGVNFTDFNAQVADTFTGFGSQYNGYGNAGQSGDYGTLLSNAIYADNTPSTITLNGLTSGTTYRLQVWVNDARQPGCCGAGRVAVFAGDAAGTDGTILFNQPAGPPGQYVIGTFIASGTSQLLNIDLGGSGTNNEQINGLLLSHAAVPEPASLALFACGAIGLVVAARRRRAS